MPKYIKHVATESPEHYNEYIQIIDLLSDLNNIDLTLPDNRDHALVIISELINRIRSILTFYYPEYHVYI